MPKQQIDEALKSFSLWLKANHWRGKEHDCVNLFAHSFLYKKIKKGNAIYDIGQIRIECGLKQPSNGNYSKAAARKDLVIWSDPEQNSWSENWEPVNIPIAVMEWKVKFKTKPKKKTFSSHDEKWIRLYTQENLECIGYVVLVDISSDQRKVEWIAFNQGEVMIN